MLSVLALLAVGQTAFYADAFYIDQAGVGDTTISGDLTVNGTFWLGGNNAIRAVTSVDNPGNGTWLDFTSVQGSLTIFKQVTPSVELGRFLANQLEAFSLDAATKQAVMEHEGFRLQSGGVFKFADGVSLNAVDSPTYDIGFGRASAGVLEINNGTLGTLRDLTARDITSGTDGQFIAQDGTFLAPGITFAGDPDTGIAKGGDDRISLITGTYAALSCNTAGCWVTSHPFFDANGPLGLCQSYTVPSIVSGVGTTHVCGQTEYDDDVFFEDGASAVNSTFAATDIDVDDGTTVTFAADPGDASKTATGLRAVGKHLLGVTGRVTTTGTNCSSIDIGDGTDVDRYGDDIAVSAGTTFDADDWTTDAMEFIPTASGAGDVVVTANGGNCFDLVVKLSVHVLDYTAATAD
jgi:hypothetical protein